MVNLQSTSVYDLRHTLIMCLVELYCPLTVDVSTAECVALVLLQCIIIL